VYQEIPAGNICCSLLKVNEGSCENCPVESAFLEHTLTEIEKIDADNRRWHISAYPAYNKAGEFFGVFLKANDWNIRHSHDKLAEESLIESERRLSMLMSNLPGLVYRCKNDHDWTMEFVSEGCFALTGYHPEDLINNKNLSYNELIVPDHQANVWSNWQDAIAQKRPYTGEYQIISAEGNRKWVWEQGRPVYDETNRVIAIEGFVQDITDRKKVGKALINTEEKYRNLVENALVGVYSTNIRGELIIANEALRRMLEFDSMEDLLAVKNVTAVYKYPADRIKMLEIMQQNDRVTDYELTWLTKRGNEIVVVISSLLSGDVISGMVMDITQRKHSEQQLLEQKERAELSDKLKASFLANISHEIRTPLNGILGFADILLEQDISKEDKHHYSNVIHNLSGQLLSIINDILEISKIETNQISLSFSQINVNQLLNKLYSNFENTAKEKKLLFSMHSELKDNEALIYADGARLVQVLNHLLNNALKFTYSGTITFGCRLTDESLQFYVQDTGIGISPENKDVIFERFRQVEDAFTRKYGGSGLGLAISKALVEMMGGEISVDTDSGKGSTFYFTIPYNSVPKSEKIHRDPRETKSCLTDSNILICEDDDFGFLYINRLLTQAGAKTTRAITGHKAIAACQTDEPFDLIIMDLRMPEMSGTDAAAYIHKIRPSVPIVACTASSSDEIELQNNKTVFDDVIFKPIIQARLLEIVCNLL
jgi:PAS domain S-box-containing protein